MDIRLVIRPVQAQDWNAWLPLWQGYNAFYGRAGATALPEVVTRTTWQRFCDAYEPVDALVAQQGERLVGLTHYLFHRSTTQVGGASSVYWQTHETKTTAMQLYDRVAVKSGFIVYRRDQA